MMYTIPSDARLSRPYFLIGLGILTSLLILNLSVRAQGPAQNEQSAMIDPYYLAYVDNDVYGVGVPSSADDRISFSNNGKYYVVREEVEKGPNFKVQSVRVMQMRPSPVITSEVAGASLPAEVDGRLYTDRYQGMADYLDVQFFFKLGPEYQNELYYIIVGRKGIGVYDYFIDDRLYRTTILTRHWKMNVLFDRQGNIEKITRKLRGQGSTDYDDFLAVVNSVKNCSSMK